MRGDGSGRSSGGSDQAAAKPNDSVMKKAHRTAARRVMNLSRPRSQAFSTKTSAPCSDATYSVNFASSCRSTPYSRRYWPFDTHARNRRPARREHPTETGAKAVLPPARWDKGRRMEEESALR